MRARRRGGITLFLAGLVLASCYQPGGPVPEAPGSPAPHEPLAQRVVVGQEAIFSPAPRGNGEIPEAHDCDAIRFLRYRPETPDGMPKPVNAVLVLLPGYYGGNNLFDSLARNLVSIAEESGAGAVEVWAMDRRPHCLEDLTGMQAAEEAGDPTSAVDYYYAGREIGGQRFAGFLSDLDVPFLSEFGLALLMDDIRTLVNTRVPDPSDRKNTVFVGGHSMGGPLAAVFAGWDFDGDPDTVEDAGFENCAGLIGLDGPLRFPFWESPPGQDLIEEEVYLRHRDAIRSGAAPRIDVNSAVHAMNTEIMALLEIFGMSASWSPDEEARRDIPYSDDTERLLLGFHSRDLVHCLSGVPAFRDFRFTNEALLGVLLDDQFQPSIYNRASLGFLHGGPVVPRMFPPGVTGLPGVENGIDAQGLFIAWDAGEPGNLGTGPVYSWTNFDEAGDESDPDYTDVTGTLRYTCATAEVTDIQDLSRVLFRGPSNAYEWYPATRLCLDLQAAGTSFGAEYGLSFLHGDRLEEVAGLEITAGALPGYNHLDVLLAAADRPSRRENEVLAPLLDFLLANSGGTVIPAP